MYREYPYRLYKIFEDIYLTSKYDKNLSNRMYSEVCLKNNIYFVNNYIRNKNKLDLYYYNKDNVHIISSRYDYSKLFVHRYYMKIDSNLNFSSFFRDLSGYSNNIFVIDFDNMDYFWLDKIINVENNLSKSEVFQ